MPESRSPRFRSFALFALGGLTLALAAIAAPQAAQAQDLTINDVTIAEGNAGTTSMTFTVTLSHAADAAFSVDYATSNVSAVAPGDYTATSGSLNFVGLPAETQTITVTINGDTTFEPNETFNVTLSNVTGDMGLTLADPVGTGSILNDDAEPPPIPTLTEWAMILLGLTLAGIAALTLQRRRAI